VLFLVIALITITFIMATRMDLEGKRHEVRDAQDARLLRAGLVIVVQAVFPFYYAILTSLEDGQALFEVNYLPATLNLANYRAMLTEGVFGKQILNSVFVATVVVVISLALAVTPPLPCRASGSAGAGCCC
jgi:ABC-type glycerol-3-phosphate transport system permease component